MIFKNSDFQKEFDDNGYVKVPFLNQEEIAQLKTAFQSLYSSAESESPAEYHVTLLESDTTYRKNVNEILLPLFENKITPLLNGFYTLTANIFVKEPHSGEVPLHQNWTYIDEGKGTCLTIWSPLIDVDENNGALQFLNGSHKKFRKILRGTGFPYPFADFAESIKPHLTKVNMKAGEALVLDESVLHYSPANHSDSPRMAIQAVIAPAGHEVYHFVCRKKWFGYNVYQINAEKDFFLNTRFTADNLLTNNKNAKKIPYEIPKLRYDDFDEILKTNV